MSNNYFDEISTDIAGKRLANNKLPIMDNMSMLSAASPQIEIDFSSMFGEIYPTSGYINTNIPEVQVEFCLSENGNFEDPFIIRYGYDYPLNIFQRIYKVRLTRTTADITFHIVAS